MEQQQLIKRFSKRKESILQSRKRKGLTQPEPSHIVFADRGRSCKWSSLQGNTLEMEQAQKDNCILSPLELVINNIDYQHKAKCFRKGSLTTCPVLTACPPLTGMFSSLSSSSSLYESEGWRAHAVSFGFFLSCPLHHMSAVHLFLLPSHIPLYSGASDNSSGNLWIGIWVIFQ